jgi:hypothetical protein
MAIIDNLPINKPTGNPPFPNSAINVGCGSTDRRNLRSAGVGQWEHGYPP